MQPSVILLTHNSEATIAGSLAAVSGLSDDLHVVDSGSTDRTLEIVRGFGAQIHQHVFVHYGAQRNWAIDTIPRRYAWELHLDADEALTPELRAEIAALPDNPDVTGYFMPRYLRFMGRLLRHNLAPTWHMRLFRTGFGRCEEREYDQHFLCSGPTAKLRHALIDDIRMPLAEWTSRHNRWSDAEAHELRSHAASGRMRSALTGNVIERKRFFKGFYERAPLFVRAIALFFYRYVFKLGFWDGTEGLIFCVLQTLWFRFLVDAKLYEARSPSPEHQRTMKATCPAKQSPVGLGEETNGPDVPASSVSA
jgi:glycosyltransferase involved in cell wall biosynthesis